MRRAIGIGALLYLIGNPVCAVLDDRRGADRDVIDLLIWQQSRDRNAREVARLVYLQCLCWPRATEAACRKDAAAAYRNTLKGKA